MKEPSYLNILDYFFNDALGSFIPGFVFLSGVFFWCYFFGVSAFFPTFIFLGGAGIWVCIIIYSFIFGHILTSLHQLYLAAKKSRFLKPALHPFVDDNKKNNARDTYELFIKKLSYIARKKGIIGLEKSSKSEIRNIAMSMDSEGQRLSVRFMFISLLCNGVGTANVLILVVFLSLNHFVGNANCLYKCDPFWYSYFSLLSSYVLFRRGHEFADRSFRAPFSVSLTNLIFSNDA